MTRKIKDIQGETFGDLLVLERDFSYVGKPIKWVCKCSCGTIKSIGGIHLRAGHTKSCGCRKRGRPAKFYKDRNGQDISLADLSRASNVEYGILWHRVNRLGWSLEKAVSTKVNRRKTVGLP